MLTFSLFGGMFLLQYVYITGQRTSALCRPEMWQPAYALARVGIHH